MPKEAPKYEMDPSFWQLPTDQSPLYEEKDPLAIEGPDEGPPEDDYDEIDTSYLRLEGSKEEDEYEGEEDPDEANKILDQLKLHNYDYVDMRLNEREMTAGKQRSYLQKIIKDAGKKRQTITPQKSKATKAFKAGKISKAEKDLIHDKTTRIEKEIADYKNTIDQNLKQ